MRDRGMRKQQRKRDNILPLNGWLDMQYCQKLDARIISFEWQLKYHFPYSFHNNNFLNVRITKWSNKRTRYATPSGRISTHMRTQFPRNSSELLSIQDWRSLYCRISGSKVSTFGGWNFPILVSYKFLASKRTSFLWSSGPSFSRNFPGNLSTIRRWTTKISYEKSNKVQAGNS